MIRQQHISPRDHGERYKAPAHPDNIMAAFPATELAPCPMVWYVGNCPRVLGHCAELRVSSHGELFCLKGCNAQAVSALLGVVPWTEVFPTLRDIDGWTHSESGETGLEWFTMPCPETGCDSEVWLSFRILLGERVGVPLDAIHAAEVCGGGN